MTDQFWKYLPHVPVNLKKPLSAKRKVEMADKEVLNLTGGLFPITLVDSIQNVHSKPAQDKKHSSNEKWVYTPILQRNTKIGPIYHWTKESDAKKLYHGEKFNFETEIVDFSETEYLQLPIANTLGWSYGRCK